MDYTLDLELLSNKHKLKKPKENTNNKPKKTLIELLNDILDHDSKSLQKKEMIYNLKKCINDINHNNTLDLHIFLNTSINIIQYFKKKELIDAIINENQNKVLKNKIQKKCVVNKTKSINVPKIKEDSEENNISISKLN